MPSTALIMRMHEQKLKENGLTLTQKKSCDYNTWFRSTFHDSSADKTDYPVKSVNMYSPINYLMRLKQLTYVVLILRNVRLWLLIGLSFVKYKWHEFDASTFKVEVSIHLLIIRKLKNQLTQNNLHALKVKLLQCFPFFQQKFVYKFRINL